LSTALLIPILALSIPIVAVLSSMVVKPWFALKERRMEIEAKMVAEKAAQYAAHNQQLEQRVRVLERIVTDKGIAVADEIERLRDDRVN
jgi:hypothetical protein